MNIHSYEMMNNIHWAFIYGITKFQFSQLNKFCLSNKFETVSSLLNAFNVDFYDFNYLFMQQVTFKPRMKNKYVTRTALMAPSISA